MANFTFTSLPDVASATAFRIQWDNVGNNVYVREFKAKEFRPFYNTNPIAGPGNSEHYVHKLYLFWERDELMSFGPMLVDNQVTGFDTVIVNGTTITGSGVTAAALAEALRTAKVIP